MRVSHVMVEIEKRLSDGNYGSEKATVQYVAQVEDGEDADDVVRELLGRSRGRVVGELRGSENRTVRLALIPPKQLCFECGEEVADEEYRDFGHYHKRCLDARDARRAEERQRQHAADVASGKLFRCDLCHRWHSGDCGSDQPTTPPLDDDEEDDDARL